jgi:competence protein ComEC
MLFPLIAGILCYSITQQISWFNFWSVSIISIVLLFLLLFGLKLKSYGKRWLFGSLLNIFIFWLGVHLSFVANQQNQRTHFARFTSDDKIVYLAELTEAPAERENSYKFTLSVRKVYVDGKLFNACGRILAYAEKDSLVKKLNYGSEILFSSRPEDIRKPANPGEFDYARYLSVKNVFHQVYLGSKSFSLTGKFGGNFLKAFALNARSRLLTTMQQNGIKGREFAVAAALLIGYDDLLDASQRQEFAGAGVIHILCVSGLHVGIIFLFTDTLLFFMRKRKKFLWLRPMLIISIIWLYALITGLAPSVMRASLMFSLITIGKSLNRPAHTYNTLAASAFILLVISPGMLYNLGFQLSYAAVIGIVTFQPHFQRILAPRNKIAVYLWGLVTVSIAAQLITVPISVYYFHQFPNYFLLANIIAIPLAGALVYSGLIFIMLSFIPLVGKILAAIVVAQIKFLNSSVAFIESLPGSVSQHLYLSPFAVIIMYLILFSGLMLYLQKKKSWFYIAILSCLLLAADWSYISISRMKQQTFMVHSINRHTVISYTSGQQQMIIADSAIIAKPAMLKYPLESSQIKSGIREIANAGISASRPKDCKMHGFKAYGNGFFSLGGKKSIVLTRELKLPPPGRQIKVDYVIITSNQRTGLKELSNYFPGATFIADASNSVRKSNTWAKEAEDMGLPFYSVRESGARVVGLE